MFRNVVTKSLRDYRWAILGWGLGMGFLVYAVYVSFTQLLGTSALSGPALQQLANQFRFFAEPIALNTAGGYVTFKYGGLLPLAVGIWSILAGARMVRGEEERGSMDLLLATPQSRAKLIGQKIGALVVAVFLIGLLIALLTIGGMAGAKTTVMPGSALLYGFDIGLTALVFGLFALVLSQFMTRAAAASWAGGLMAFTWFLDGTGRAVNGLSGLQRVSPFFYYQLSKPLIASYGTNSGALLVLAVLCLLCIVVAVPLFARRDVGRTVFADLTAGRVDHSATSAQRAERALAAAQRGASLRGVGIQALARARGTIGWWVVSLFLFTGFLVIVTRSIIGQIQQLLGNNSSITKLLGGHDLATNAGFLAGVLFLYLPLLVALFAGLIAYRWPTDLADGRLELVLSTPEPRSRALLERFGAVVVAAVAAIVSIWLAILLGADVSSLSLDFGHVTQSALGLLPLELVTAALVYALAGVFRSGLVLTILAIFLAISFLVDLLLSILNLPSWLAQLSIFHQYGSPITDGLSWGAFFGMLAVAAVLLGLGLVEFVRGDVERGSAG
jgi:ABC-2 type transport system permease protein